MRAPPTAACPSLSFPARYNSWADGRHRDESPRLSHKNPPRRSCRSCSFARRASARWLAAVPQQPQGRPGHAVSITRKGLRRWWGSGGVCWLAVLRAARRRQRRRWPPPRPAHASRTRHQRPPPPPQLPSLDDRRGRRSGAMGGDLNTTAARRSLPWGRREGYKSAALISSRRCDTEPEESTAHRKSCTGPRIRLAARFSAKSRGGVAADSLVGGHGLNFARECFDNRAVD